jgi:hypothetical protein
LPILPLPEGFPKGLNVVEAVIGGLTNGLEPGCGPKRLELPKGDVAAPVDVALDEGENLKVLGKSGLDTFPKVGVVDVVNVEAKNTEGKPPDGLPEAPFGGALGDSGGRASVDDGNWNGEDASVVADSVGLKPPLFGSPALNEDEVKAFSPNANELGGAGIDGGLLALLVSALLALLSPAAGFFVLS